MLKNHSSIESGNIILSLDIGENDQSYEMSIESAMARAEIDLLRLNETIDSLKALKPDCDNLDYILAASSGALCGIIDIFLVGKPGESPVGKMSDKWFLDRTKDFAKICGWCESSTVADNETSAIRFLEKRFNVPYDQRGAGDAASLVYELNPRNHHFKSIAHNPSMVGLYFSILDQFANTSHFVTGGDFLALERADDSFELVGNNIPSKFFCAFVNWFGHIISDMSGSSGSVNRGMGLPSPFWSWTNDLIILRRKLSIPPTEFDNVINELAFNIFKEGFDLRYQAAQLIPVIVNEMVVRFLYATRRLFKYLCDSNRRPYCFSEVWKMCEPFANATIKRMLTVAHGTFCLIDLGDATIRGFIGGAGSFDVKTFCLRINIAGVSRFTISLYGETKRELLYLDELKNYENLRKERAVLENYIGGLQILADMYRDQELLTFVEDFRNSGAYKKGFEKTVKLTELRGVPDELILRNKADIDAYFRRGKK